MTHSISRFPRHLIVLGSLLGTAFGTGCSDDQHRLGGDPANDAGHGTTSTGGHVSTGGAGGERTGGAQSSDAGNGPAGGTVSGGSEGTETGGRSGGSGGTGGRSGGSGGVTTGGRPSGGTGGTEDGGAGTGGTPSGGSDTGGTHSGATGGDAPGGAAGNATDGGTGGQGRGGQGGDVSCTFEANDLPSAYANSATGETCSSRDTYDGTAEVTLDSTPVVKLSYGDGCILSIGRTSEDDVTQLPAVDEGDTVWLTYRQGLGIPYSGDSHYGLALRTAEDGPLIFALYGSSDRNTSTALLSAEDLGLSLSPGEPQCMVPMSNPGGCWRSATMVYRSIEVAADSPVTVPSRSVREIMIDGQGYQFFAIHALDYEDKVADPNCADGPSLAGSVRWVLWPSPAGG